ncbi:MAG: MBOAT family protein [bacterium]
MIFSSVLFLFWFLPVALAAYYLCPPRWRNIPALGFSLLFFAWGAPLFVFVLVASCAVDYWIGPRLAAGSGNDRRRKLLLAAVLTFNLGLLCYFKYANFFVGQFNAVIKALGGAAIPWAEVALPIGISFFTFHKISYLVDVYRGVVKPARKYTDYLLYIALFPQLIAGPIIRYHDVAEQIQSRFYSSRLFLDGVWRFCLGLGKKVLLANSFGTVADAFFAKQPGELGVAGAWVGTLAYAFQIYFDFSGYSDMAIGLGRMMGIRFLENFEFPYISRSVTEFWRRWHISLGNFMREYLYLPLGGNRVAPWRVYFNLWVVFAISGLWHGAAWTFVAWGAYQGFLLTFERFIWRRNGIRKEPPRIMIVVTFMLICIGWVFFRSESIGYAFQFLGAMFGAGGMSPGVSAMLMEQAQDVRIWVAVAVGILVAFAPLFKIEDVMRDWSVPAGGPGRTVAFVMARFAACVAIGLASASVLVNGGFNPFIYFRF